MYSSKFLRLFILISILEAILLPRKRKFPSINPSILQKHISEWKAVKMNFLKALFVQDPNKKAPAILTI